MMRTPQPRVMVVLLATAIGAIGGVLAGYWLGRAIVLRQAEARLDQYAVRILTEGNSSTSESRTVLAKLNSSPYSFCSDAEIAYFRQLVFQSQYLKGAGRIRDGRINCSTTQGRSAQSHTKLKPDFAQRDGTLVYRNLELFRIGKETVITVALGDSYIVYSPYFPNSFTNSAMHYTVTDLDAPDQKRGLLLGESPEADSSILTRQGRTRAGDSLYATRCSADGAVCTTGYMSTPEALWANRVELAAFVLLSGLTGASFGFFCSLVHCRKKGIRHQLQRAIRRDALRVVYQPIVDLASGRIVEAEALVRWTDEDQLSVPPDVFIKVAEEQGFVGGITKLVVRHVLRDFGSTMRERSGFRVNVNIAAADLADPKFLPMLEESLAQANVSAKSLGIEITESYTARQQVAKETILHLRQRGHFVHIDDFGTGYSSLAYLHDLSVDAIKIDKAFTKAIGTEAVTVSILPQILNMAEALKLRVVVEGIETPQQASYFAAANQAIFAQGWLFGHPVAAEAFRRILVQNEMKSESDRSVTLEDSFTAPLQIA
ncbi:MAG: EAL domain-containing protein [Terracidiphilus sp.]